MNGISGLHGQPGPSVGDLVEVRELPRHGDHDPSLGVGGKNSDDDANLSKISAVFSFRHVNLHVLILDPAVIHDGGPVNLSGEGDVVVTEAHDGSIQIPVVDPVIASLWVS